MADLVSFPDPRLEGGSGDETMVYLEGVPWVSWNPFFEGLRSEIQNFPGGGGMPPDPPSRRPMCALIGLIAYWNPLFPKSRSATEHVAA